MSFFRKISLKFLIGMIVFIPLISFLVVSTLYLVDKNEIRTKANVILTNMKLVSSIHKAVDSLQKERGISAGFIKGSADIKGMQARRGKTDKLLLKLKSDLELKEILPKSYKTIKQELIKLPAFRKWVDQKKNLKQHLKNYTALITTLLNHLITLENYAAGFPFSSQILSMRILEESKENQGKLRANMTAVIASGKPASKAKKEMIANLKHMADGTLNAPYLHINKGNKEIIASFAKKPYWKFVNEIYGIIIDRSSSESTLFAQEGVDYKKEAVHFFKQISKTVADINKVVESEAKDVNDNVTKRIEKINQSFYELVIMLVVVLVIAVMISLQGIKIILSGTESIVNYIKKLGEGDFLFNFDNKFKNEFGVIGDGLKKMAHDIHISRRKSEEMADHLQKLPSPLLEIDTEFNVKFVNDAMAQLVDRSSEECVGKKCYDLLKSDDCQTKNCALAICMKSGKVEKSSAVACPLSTKIPVDYFGNPVKNEDGTVRGAIEFIIDQSQVYEVASKLGEASKKLENITSSMRTVSDHLLHNSDQLAQQATTASAAVEEISATIENISDRTTSSAQDVGKVTSGAQEMKNNMDVVASSIEELAGSFKEIVTSTQAATKVADNAAAQSDIISKSMDMLTEVASNIGSFVNIISGIASQTNLLALNATIEAARAGEAGKGFAVVATEVKELSQQTTDSAEDISKRISQIQKAANESNEKISNIVNIMKDIQNQNQTVAATVEEQAAIAAEISSSVSIAAKAVEDVTEKINQIKYSVEDITNSIGEASTGMGDISRATMTVTEAVGIISDDSKDIVNQSEEIENLKDNFDKIVKEFSLLDKLDT